MLPLKWVAGREKPGSGSLLSYCSDWTDMRLRNPNGYRFNGYRDLMK